MDAAINRAIEQAAVTVMANGASAVKRGLFGGESSVRNDSTPLSKKNRIETNPKQTLEAGNMSTIQAAGMVSRRAHVAKSAFGRASLSTNALIGMLCRSAFTRANTLRTGFTTALYTPGIERAPFFSTRPTAEGKVPVRVFPLGAAFNQDLWQFREIDSTLQTWSSSAVSGMTVTNIKNSRDNSAAKYIQDVQYLKWVNIKLMFTGGVQRRQKYRVLVWRATGHMGDYSDDIRYVAPMIAADYRKGVLHPCSVTRNLQDEGYAEVLSQMNILADRQIVLEPHINISEEAGDSTKRGQHVEEIFVPIYRETSFIDESAYANDVDAETTAKFVDNTRYARHGDNALEVSPNLNLYETNRRDERLYLAVWSYEPYVASPVHEETGFDMSVESAYLLERAIKNARSYYYPAT